MCRARRYYHLSDQRGLGILTVHRTEESFCSNKEAIAWRVCVSSSIAGCIRALYLEPGDRVYVYTVVVDDDTDFIPNKYVKYLVPDAHITKESWIMQDIECSCPGRIEVIQGGDNPKWKWIEKLR